MSLSTDLENMPQLNHLQNGEGPRASRVKVSLRCAQSGAFRTAVGDSLSIYATPARQMFALPDTFDQYGTWYRAVEGAGSTLLFALQSDGWLRWKSLGTSVNQIEVEAVFNRLVKPLSIPKSAMRHLPPTLRARFQSRNPAVHLASASLDEAVFKAIIRQVIRAEHAIRLIDRVVALAGRTITYDGRLYKAFPLAADILMHSTESLSSIGLGFKASRLRSVAQALLATDLNRRYATLSSEELASRLRAIPGIGAWTAQTCVSDIHSNWAAYPIDDLAVRTWAKRLWPDGNWPEDPSLFAEQWRRLNGGHLGIVTFFLLAIAKLDCDNR